jgi:hypothetical protein
MLVLAILLWAAALGLRGILSHQLRCEELDRKMGLTTVVHDVGHSRILKLVLYVIRPIELLSFMAILLQYDGSAILTLGAGVFVAYELLKSWNIYFTVAELKPKVQAYIPFVEDGIYKVWAVLIISADATLHDPLFLAVVPVYILLFWRRVYYEWRQIRLPTHSAFVRMR